MPVSRVCRLKRIGQSAVVCACGLTRKPKISINTYQHNFKGDSFCPADFFFASSPWNLLWLEHLLLLKLQSIATSPNILAHPIEYLKGVGPHRADLLKKELAIFTFNDLL